jgi:hypothetical protein
MVVRRSFLFDFFIWLTRPSRDHRTTLARYSHGPRVGHVRFSFLRPSNDTRTTIARYSHEACPMFGSYSVSNDDRTSVVRWSYNYRTIIVRSSYDDCTKVVRSSLFYLRVARSSLYLSTFAWWRGVPAGGVTNRKRGPPKNRFAYLNDGTLGGYRPANLKSVGITMLVRW